MLNAMARIYASVNGMVVGSVGWRCVDSETDEQIDLSNSEFQDLQRNFEAQISAIQWCVSIVGISIENKELKFYSKSEFIEELGKLGYNLDLIKGIGEMKSSKS